MIREEVIKLAHKTELLDEQHYGSVWADRLMKFADAITETAREAMVRDGWRQCAAGQQTTQFCNQLEDAVLAEREACAKVCDHEMDNAMNLGMKVAAGNCADKIRARNTN